MSGLKLYPYQEKTIQDLCDPEKHICIAGVGAGKGAIMLHWLKSTGKTKWLVATTASKRDSKDVEHEAVAWFGEEFMSHIQLEVISWHGLAKWTVSNWNKFDDWAVALDECLPADTLVKTDKGEKQIADLRVGDKVWSMNLRTGTLELKSITRLIKKPCPDKMYCLRWRDGAIISTGNHPHYTQRGWVAAEDIKVGDTVYELATKTGRVRTQTEEIWQQREVCLLPENNTCRNLDRATDTTSEQGEGLLQQGVQLCLSQSEMQRTYETEQPNGEPSLAGKSDPNEARDGAPTSVDSQARAEGWQRALHGAADNTVQGSKQGEQGVGDGTADRPRQATSRLSDLLQGRRGEHLLQDSSGVRRGQPQWASGKEQRCEEDGEVRGVRVESVEVLQRGDIKEHELYRDPDNVYCIDVEDNHNFFANGVLTHNCHLGKAGVSSQRGRAFIQIAKQTDCWTGYTATPGDRWIDFQAYFIACGLVKNKTSFMREFCEVQTFKGFPEIVGYRSVNILKHYWKSITVFPDTSAMLAELPEERHFTTHFQPSPAYKKFLKDRICPDGEFADSVMKFCHTCRQLCFTKAKAQWLSDYLENLGTNTVLFYNYIAEGDEIEKIANKVLPNGAKIWRIDGKHHDIPTEDKMGKYDIVLAQYTSGSASLNLQFINEMVLVSPNYSLTTSTQARGRIRRIGQKKNMIFHYLLTDNSIEADVYRCLRGKSDFAMEQWAAEHGVVDKGDNKM